MMAHLDLGVTHRTVGDPVLFVIPIVGLAAADVGIATWRCAGEVTVDKALLSGVTVLDGAAAKVKYPSLDWTVYVGGERVAVDDAAAVLEVDVDPADTTSLGVGRWRWQATSGGSEAPVVASGFLVLTKALAPAVP
jgi:hypothetical protein